MATFLHRVGRWAFRQRGTVVLVWLAVTAAAVFGAVSAPAAPDDSSAMPGIESQQAFDLINERFPGSAADGAQARIVFVAEDGRQVTSAGSRAAIDQFVSSAANGPQVAQANSPFATDSVSEDGFTAYA